MAAWPRLPNAACRRWPKSSRLTAPSRRRLRIASSWGSRLVREWHGRTHTVEVTDSGFEYAGKLYSSLTKIAFEITGAQWSGPRFFGLTKNGAGATARSIDVNRGEGSANG